LGGDRPFGARSPLDTFLAAFDDIPDPRSANVRHDLCGLLVVGFVAVLCGAVSCAEMSDFGRAKEHVFRGFLKLIPTRLIIDLWWPTFELRWI